MLYYSSVISAMNELVDVVLKPENYMDNEEKVNLANFYLSITSYEEFRIFLKYLIRKTNEKLISDGICTWEKNGCDSLIDSAIKYWDIPSEIFPDNLKFEINRKQFNIIDQNKINDKIYLLSLLPKSI